MNIFPIDKEDKGLPWPKIVETSDSYLCIGCLTRPYQGIIFRTVPSAGFPDDILYVCNPCLLKVLGHLSGTDPIKVFAYQAIIGDPMAVDLIQDALRNG